MEVILKNDIPKVGTAGSVIRVSDGYARNYLFPHGFAVPKTASNAKLLERQHAQQQVQTQKTVQHAQDLKVKLEALSVTIPMLIQEDEKLYGSVSVIDILKALKDEGITIEKSQIELEEPMKSLGIYEVPVKLHPDIIAKVKIWVVKK
jgi:large subunit ribosomal protein L9